MNSYREKYLKYKTKYIKLKELQGGNPGIVILQALFFDGYLDNTEVDYLKNQNLDSNIYNKINILIRNNSLPFFLIKSFIEENKNNSQFENLLNKFLYLISNGIDANYAISLTNTKYSVDEIIKYKDFRPNFILNILNFTLEQKQRLERLLAIKILPVLAYHIVNNNKNDEQEAEIISIYNSNPEDYSVITRALKLAQNNNDNT